jgi:hypothetical protein
VALKARVTSRGPAGEALVREQTITAVKEGGDWKLAPEAGDLEGTGRLLDLTHTLFKARAEQFVKEVQAGKYKSREEAEMALRENPPIR